MKKNIEKVEEETVVETLTNEEIVEKSQWSLKKKIIVACAAAVVLILGAIALGLKNASDVSNDENGSNDTEETTALETAAKEAIEESQIDE